MAGKSEQVTPKTHTNVKEKQTGEQSKTRQTSNQTKQNSNERGTKSKLKQKLINQHENLMKLKQKPNGN